MTTLKAFALAGIILMVGLLMIGAQQYRIKLIEAEKVAADTRADNEQEAKEKALSANLVSQATITTLQAELARNELYAADLNKRIRDSEEKAKKARGEYNELKKKSKPVRDWAAQPLPDGLRKRTKQAGGRGN